MPNNTIPPYQTTPAPVCPNSDPVEVVAHEGVNAPAPMLPRRFRYIAFVEGIDECEDFGFAMFIDEFGVYPNEDARDILNRRFREYEEHFELREQFGFMLYDIESNPMVDGVYQSIKNNGTQYVTTDNLDTAIDEMTTGRCPHCGSLFEDCGVYASGSWSYSAYPCGDEGIEIDRYGIDLDRYETYFECGSCGRELTTDSFGGVEW